MKGHVDEYLELSCPCHPSQLHLFDYHFTRHVYIYIYICVYIYTAIFTSTWQYNSLSKHVYKWWTLSCRWGSWLHKFAPALFDITISDILGSNQWKPLFQTPISGMVCVWLSIPVALAVKLAWYQLWSNWALVTWQRFPFQWLFSHGDSQLHSCWPKAWRLRWWFFTGKKASFKKKQV